MPRQRLGRQSQAARPITPAVMTRSCVVTGRKYSELPCLAEYHRNPAAKNSPMERSRRAIGPQATAMSLFGRWHRLSKWNANMTELTAAIRAAASEPQSKGEHAPVDSRWPRNSLPVSAAADRIASVVASCCTALQDSILSLALVCDAVASVCNGSALPWETLCVPTLLLFNGRGQTEIGATGCKVGN